MTTLTIGDLAPDFTLPDDAGNAVSLSGLKGQKIILYFYPKDDTPGCTTQACDFTTLFPDFKDTGAVILGVSKDSVVKHQKFKEKYNLTFPLLSDEKTQICEAYGVFKEKSMYGKTYMGIERTTFLIDETGHIAHIWPKVSVTNHVKDVLEKLKSL